MRFRELRSRAVVLLAVASVACSHAHSKPEHLAISHPHRHAALSPVPVVRAEPPPGVVHTVEPGETLFRIARAYGVSVEALQQANGILDAREVDVGMRLVVPDRPQVVPIPAADLDGATIVDEVSHTPAHRPGCVGKKCLAWPLRGVIYGRFGTHVGEGPPTAIHEGLDLAAPEGTPIAAADSGRVIYAGDQKGYGNVVIIEHPSGLITLYAHNRENLVKEGARVQRGQVIARVGSSGRTSGPQVHFEVREAAKPVDPLGLLPTPAHVAPSLLSKR